MKALENRIPPPVVASLFAVLMWAVAQVTPAVTLHRWWVWVGVVVLLLVGALFCGAGVLSFRRARTTVNPLTPDKASSLVESGIYRYSRNPMYVGFAFFLLAWSVYLLSTLALLGVVGFILYMNRFQILPEERALARNFPSAFADYQRRVRRWL